jgi:RHS repeat-associated protein
MHGRTFEPEIGLYFYRARYLHPGLGRFIQCDPMGYEDSMNMYQSFNQNPVNFTDPMGEEIYIIDVTPSSNRIKANPSPMEIWYELRKQLTSTLAAKTLRHSERYSNIDESQLIRAEFTLRTGAFTNIVGPGARFAMGASPAGDVSDWTAVATGYDPMEDEHVSFFERGLYVAGGLLPVVKGKHLKKIYKGGEKVVGKMVDFFKGLFKSKKAIKIESIAEQYFSLTKGKVVFGHLPHYKSYAKEIGADFLDIPKEVWDKLSKSEAWALNKLFLDEVIKRGDEIYLATELRKGRSFYKKELKYLKKHGYIQIGDRLYKVK